MDRETVDEIKRHIGIFAEDLRAEMRLIADGLRTEIRLLGVVTEGLRAETQLVAEGQTLLRGDVDRLDAKVDGLSHVVQLTHSELTGRLNDHETRIGELERRRR